MSKVSNPRPTDKEKYNENYDLIFGKKPIKEEKPKDNEQDRSKWT